MFSSSLRVIKFASQDFFRNFWLSFVTLTILVLALFSINMLVVFNLIASSAISSIENKIDINIYFKPEIKDDQVQNVKRHLENSINVKEVQYISPDEALQNFRDKHKDNEKILQSLAEIDKNPLGASLVIKAKTTADYPLILENLKDPQYDNLIESKDFEDYRLVIDRISGITKRVNQAVAVIALIFISISILIILNAIRMSVYSHREEIIAMKLVGATNRFVRAPFLLQGVFFACLSVFFTIIIIFPLLGVIQPYIKLMLENDFNIVDYFKANFFFIFGLELLGAIIVNLASSFWAVNKYVKV